MRLSFTPFVVGLAVVLVACGGGGGDGSGGSADGPGGPGTIPGDALPGQGNSAGAKDDAGGTPIVASLAVGAAARVALGRGGPVSIPVKLTRTGTIGAVVVRITGLPSGFTSDPVTVASTASEATLTLRASEAASESPVNATIEAAAGALNATSPLLVTALRQQNDVSFGQAGVVHVSGIRITDALPLDDGKLLAYGTAAVPYNRSFLRRFGADGALDTTFGTGGELRLPDVVASPAHHMDAASLAPKGDGSVYASFRGSYSGMPTQIVIAHVLANGSFDTSFGASGYAKVEFDVAPEVTPSGLAVRADGTILVVGSGTAGSGSAATVHGLLARFTAAGQLDATFGTGGKVVSDFGSTAAIVRGVRTVGGATYVFGRTAYAAGGFPGFVARIGEAGALDATFGSGGVVATALEITAAEPTPAGKWIVTGPGYVSQLTSAGSKDTSFGEAGYILATSPLPGVGYAMNDYAIGVDTSGRIATLLGSISHDRFELWSFDAAGARRPSFGGGGSIMLDTSGNNPLPVAMRRTADGRFVAFGVISTSPYESALMRFFP